MIIYLNFSMVTYLFLSLMMAFALYLLYRQVNRKGNKKIINEPGWVDVSQRYTISNDSNPAKVVEMLRLLGIFWFSPSKYYDFLCKAVVRNPDINLTEIITFTLKIQYIENKLCIVTYYEEPKCISSARKINKAIRDMIEAGILLEGPNNISVSMIDNVDFSPIFGWWLTLLFNSIKKAIVSLFFGNNKYNSDYIVETKDETEQDDEILPMPLYYPSAIPSQ